MKPVNPIVLVKTIGERCRTCYTCVRECPAKAIRIVEGQADVIPGRCIGCGNCVRVCGQGAKQVYDSVGEVRDLLRGEAPVAAILAPSFPSEFVGLDYRKVVGVLRQLGFHYVLEVAFGADLVADRYRKLLETNEDISWIATTCPAVVSYVERYFPELVDDLAPLVSPMAATARVAHERYGDHVKTVFIGPCIAKKGEADCAVLHDEVDAVLTFSELRHIIEIDGIDTYTAEDSDFDPPHGGPGALFSISRGLLQAADLPEDLVTGDVIVAEGSSGFAEAVKEFHLGHCHPKLLESLACEGCIMGPGVSNKDPLFRRRQRVSDYVRQRLDEIDMRNWQQEMDAYAQLDLARSFMVDDQRMGQPSPEDIEAIMRKMGKLMEEDELNCGACGYDTCVEHAIAIYQGLAESEMCLPYTIDKLRETVKSLAVSNDQLAQTRETLEQAEKLASMGQLAAGIAHELNNPLGVVLMYAHLLLDEEAENIDPEVRDDLDMIASQADRCKKIVSGLLHFARQNKVAAVQSNIFKLAQNCVQLVNIPENVTVRVEHDGSNPMADLDRDQMTQVLTNLIGNACQAMPNGGELFVHTASQNGNVEFIVSDTGMGIPEENRQKIFDPFFTTKPIGEGTGMGLAVSYGIVKMHQGAIRLESNDDPEAGPTGATFTVSLPRNRSLLEEETSIGES